MMALALRPLSVGEVLDRAFQVYRRSFASMYLVALVGALPGLLFALAVAKLAPSAAGMLGRMLVFLLLVCVGSLFAWGALAQLVDGAVHERPAGVGFGLRRGLRYLPALLAANALLWTICLLHALPVGLLALLAAGMGRTHTADLVGLAFLGALLVLVAAAQLTVGFLLPPVIALERRGPWAALRRSYRLCRDAPLRTLGVALMTAAIAALPTIAVDLLPTILADVGVPTKRGSVALSVLFSVWAVTSGLTPPFTTGCMVLAYYDRRVRLEGLDVELASAALEPTT